MNDSIDFLNDIDEHFMTNVANVKIDKLLIISLMMICFSFLMIMLVLMILMNVF